MKNKLAIQTLMPILAVLSVPTANAYSEIHPYFGVKVLTDDNYIRSENDPESESILTMKAGVNGFLEVSRQTLNFDVNIGKNKYLTNRDSEFNSHSATLDYNWEVGSNTAGHIKASRVKSLTSFENDRTLASQGVQQTRQNASFTVDRKLDTKWSIELGLDLNTLNYDDDRYNQSDRTWNTFSTELTYLTPYNNKFGVRYERLVSKYPNRSVTDTSTLDNKSYLNSLYLTTHWSASNKSIFHAKAGYQKLESANLSGNDYDSFSGSVTHNWKASGALDYVTRIYYKTNTVDSTFATFQRTAGVLISPVLKYSAKQTFKGRVNIYNAKANGGVSDSTLSGFDENYQTIGVTWEYTPVRNWLIGLSYDYNARDSNLTNRDYKSNSASLNVNFTW